MQYIQHRGNTFFFRISVPKCLRKLVGCSEIVRTLNTSDGKKAKSQALILAGTVKSLLSDLKNSPSQKTIDAPSAVAQNSTPSIERINNAIGEIHP
jgi:hypothetical protein